MALGLIDRLRVRRDPIRREARQHLYPSLTSLSDRIALFRDATPEVQRQVLVELDLVADDREPGARGPAMLGVITVVATSVTLLLGFLLALMNGAIATTPYDHSTGKFTGAVGEKLFEAVEKTQSTVIGLIVALIAIALLVWLFSWQSDRERVRARAWSRVFREAQAPQRDSPEIRASRPRLAGHARYRKRLLPGGPGDSPSR